MQVDAAFDKARKSVPPWKLLPAVTQAVSNIVHPHALTETQLQRLIAGVTIKHPNHCLWMLFAVRNSEAADRRAAAKKVYDHVVAAAPAHQKALMSAHDAVCKGVMVRCHVQYAHCIAMRFVLQVALLHRRDGGGLYTSAIYTTPCTNTGDSGITVKMAARVDRLLRDGLNCASLFENVQELAEWDPRRNPGVRPVPNSQDTFHLKSISRGLASTQRTPVMVPMLQAFEAGAAAVLQGAQGQLDALVTIAGVTEEARARLPGTVRMLVCAVSALFPGRYMALAHDPNIAASGWGDTQYASARQTREQATVPTAEQSDSNWKERCALVVAGADVARLRCGGVAARLAKARV